MGRKMESAMIPYNDYGMELGAHEPPAPPEKELAEMRGMWQTLLAAAIGIFIWFFFLDPNHGWLHWGLNGAPSNESSVETTSPVSTEPVSAETTAPAEGEKGIGFIAFLNKKTGRLENLLDNETYHISPGDTIEVWGYSDFAEIKHIVYYIPEIHPLDTALPSIPFEDGIGIISLPDYPAGEYFHLYVKVEDVDGNYSEYQQYILIYESNE